MLPVIANASGGITALTNEEVAAQQAQNALPAGYVDQLIDERLAEDEVPVEQPVDDADSSPEQAEPLHFWTLSTGANYFQDDRQPANFRFNTDLNAGYQTLSYGDFRLQAKLSAKRDADQTQATERGSYFTLQQDNFALNESWTMESTLGVNQNFQNRLISSSGYVNLASHAFWGGAFRAYSDKTEIRFMVGEKGYLTDLSEFVTEGEKVAGAGIARRLSPHTTIGGQAWFTKTNIVSQEEEQIEREFSAFVRYENDENQRSMKLQILSAEGQHGIWADGQFNSGRFNHQAGFYYLDDNLSWMGETVNDNVQGAFWRMTMKHPRFSVNTSLDWQQRDAGSTIGLRQSVSYHLNRSTQLGAGLSYSHTEDEQIQTENHRAYLNTYVFHQFENGQQGRLQLALTDTRRPDILAEQLSRSYELNYSHQWLLPANNKLDAQFTARRESQSENSHDTVQAGLIWRKEMMEGGHVGLDFSGSRSISAANPATSLSARLRADYRVNKSWSLSGSAGYSHQVEDQRGQLSANLQVTYQDSRGQAITTRQRRSGNIRGVVFYDENNDGIRQPLEKTAANITVGLDKGGLPQVTDRNGEFEFLRIKPDSYRVGVAEETIPLPWELAQSGFQQVEVTMRQTEFVYLPLVRLSAIE